MSLDYQTYRRFPLWPALACTAAAIICGTIAVSLFGLDRTLMYYRFNVGSRAVMRQPAVVVLWLSAAGLLASALVLTLMRMFYYPPTTPPVFRSRARSSAFTLIELLVVIGIVTLMLGLAMVAFRSLTGSHSEAAAANILTATLGHIRNQAIGMQRHHGAMFYRDLNTGRIGIIAISETNPPATPTGPADVWYDLDANSEPVLLPAGVGLQTLLGAVETGGVRTHNGYVGYNTVGIFVVPVGGVLAFDPDGQLSVTVPGMVLGGGANTTALGRFLCNGTNTSGMDNMSWYQPMMGVALFDADAYTSQFGGDAAWADAAATTPAQYVSMGEQAKEAWLDSAATPYLVNRYNGTLIKGE